MHHRFQIMVGVIRNYAISTTSEKYSSSPQTQIVCHITVWLVANDGGLLVMTVSTAQNVNLEGLLLNARNASMSLPSTVVSLSNMEIHTVTAT